MPTDRADSLGGLWRTITSSTLIGSITALVQKVWGDCDRPYFVGRFRPVGARVEDLSLQTRAVVVFSSVPSKRAGLGARLYASVGLR